MPNDPGAPKEYAAGRADPPRSDGPGPTRGPGKAGGSGPAGGLRTIGGPGDRAVVFTALWALAQIGHILRKASPADPLSWIWLVAAMALLIRPRSAVRVAVLATAQLLYLSVDLPITDNHAYVMGFVDLGLLSAVVFRGRSCFRLPERYLWATLLISYGAAATAKLNHAFFDPAVSCAVEMFYDASRAVGLDAGSLPWMEPILPWVIAITELLIPISLLVPRIRRAGVVLVVLFHWGMSLSPTATAADFTLMLFALVVLFLPAEAATVLRDRFDRARRRLPEVARTGALPFAALAILVSTALATGWGPPGNANWIWLAMTAVVVGWQLIAVAMTVRGSPRASGSRGSGSEHAVIGGSRPSRSGPGEPPSGPAWWRALRVSAFAGLLLLQLLNVSAPYLGVKTVGSYIMYSNLQTEMHVSNHFFLPRLPLDAPIDDFVEIVDSSHPALLRTRDQGDLMSWHEMRRYLRQDPAASVSYRRDGVLHVHEQARENPELIGGSTLLNTLIAHRAYDPRRAICRW